MKLKKYTLEQLKEAIKTSFSIRQVLIKLNIVEAGGNYTTFKKIIDKYDLDVSHFTGKVWNKGKITGPKRPLDYYLKYKRTNTNDLKQRLIKEGVLIHQCSSCDLTEWKNQPIPLELHHKDGNSRNNELSNLQLLCPNCHAQTTTYRGKNINSKVATAGIAPA